LPERGGGVTILEAKGMDEIAVYLRAVARRTDVMKEIFAGVEYLHARCGFPEEGAANVVLIAGKFDAGRKAL
jgi:hypothetical protein